MASFRYSLTTSLDRPNPTWQVTQRIRRECRNYNNGQIRLWPWIFLSGITGRPVPLSGLPRPNIVRPHWQLDGVSPNLFANLTQSLTAALSHRFLCRHPEQWGFTPTTLRNDTLNPSSRIDPGFPSFVLSVLPTHTFSLGLQHSPNNPCTKQIRVCRELRVLLSREQQNTTKDKIELI